MTKTDKNAEKKDKIYEYYKDTPIKRWAAAYAGISDDTLKRWEKDDKVFADHLRNLKAAFLRKRLNSSKNHEWVLERMFTEEFSKAGDNDKPLEINNYMNIPDEQLERIIESKLNKARKTGDYPTTE